MIPLAIPALTLALFMTALFAVAMRLNNNGVADVGYGLAFIALISAAALQSSPLSPVAMLMIALPVTWGFRLAIRIGWKNANKPEDFRYAEWRKSWGDSFFIRSFLQIYMLQGLVVFCIAMPIILLLAFPANHDINAVTILGIVIWGTGFAFEAIGDYQLDQFVANPANHGKIMMSGLWKYSRHPNYFGEILMWWGIAIAAMPLTKFPFVGMMSPVLITFLLLKVSGVPMLEKRWEGHPSWNAYKMKTSVLVPWPPGK